MTVAAAGGSALAAVGTADFAARSTVATTLVRLLSGARVSAAGRGTTLVAVAKAATTLFSPHVDDGALGAAAGEGSGVRRLRASLRPLGRPSRAASGRSMVEWIGMQGGVWGSPPFAWSASLVYALVVGVFPLASPAREGGASRVMGLCGAVRKMWAIPRRCLPPHAPCIP